MNEGALDLSAPRDLGGLLACTFGLQRRWFGVFFWVTAIINVPVIVLIDGVWNRELVDGRSSNGPAGAALAALLLGSFAVPALVTALHVRIVQALSAGEQPSVGSAFRLVGPAVLPALGATAVYVLGMAVGFVLLFVPGLIILVRWYFAPQFAVVEGELGAAAATASNRLVRGRSAFVVGCLIVSAITFTLITTVPQLLFTGAAPGIYVAAHAVFGTIGISLSALFGTLLFFSLRAAQPAPFLPPQPGPTL